ncbi:MAG TPA: sodium:proton antiporter [Flavobacteriales bacterium]|nr:sodium:proton antiporter [Flavobacteriales bacterium]
MFILMLIIFIVGYTAIATEHNIRVDKSATALVIGSLTWAVFILGAPTILHVDTSLSVREMLDSGTHILKSLKEYFIYHFEVPADEMPTTVTHFVLDELRHHLVEISEILFFLLGAMTIVELVDAHNGFSIITDKIKTTNKLKLLISLSLITFAFSAVLDNLTTAIVMSALLKKLISDKKDLWLFAGFIIIAANAGGAFSPIGDVTTIMLWIGGQITAINIIQAIVVPSLVCLAVPMLYMAVSLKGNVTRPEESEFSEHLINPASNKEKNIIFFLGIAALLFVPIFKTITHLPPFVGILLGLGVIWVVTELMHKSKNHEEKNLLSVVGVLRKVDVPSVLFFLGILMAVASLSSAGHLIMLANFLEKNVGNMYVVNIIIGLLSSIVDNVPLVAGAMGMYEIGPEVAGVSYPVDHSFWEFLAYCAGTGGSCLIIGSAAGVAVMGILKIDFMWYLRRISLLALAGYLSGALVFFLENTL